MAAFQYRRARNSVNERIRYWGGREATRARLVRDGQQRVCVAARLEYTPRERGLFEDGSSRILIAGNSVTIPPDNELDLLLFAGKHYRIMQVTGYRQGDDTVLYYDCNVVECDAPQQGAS